MSCLGYLQVCGNEVSSSFGVETADQLFELNVRFISYLENVFPSSVESPKHISSLEKDKKPPQASV